MFMNKDLVSVPNTINRLGAPAIIGLDSPGIALVSGTDPMDDYVDYAYRVRLDTPIDVPIGTVISETATEYPGQTKFAKSPSSNVFATSYIGLEQIFSEDFSSDPPDWADVNTPNAHNSDNNNVTITFTPSGSTFQCYYKDLGLGTDIDNSVDFVLRTQFVLPESGSSEQHPVIGIRDNADSDATTNTVGIAMQYSSGWRARFYINDAIDTDTDPILLEAGVIYTMDIYYRSRDAAVQCVIRSSAGLVGDVSTYAGFFTTSVTANSIGIWNRDTGGSASNFSMEVYSFAAWMNTIIVKLSPNNCRTWYQVPVNIAAVGEEITECAVGVEDNSVVHLVWTEKTGTPTGQYNIFYSSFNYTTGLWSTTTQVSQTSGAYDRINPLVEVSEFDTSVHIAWADESASGVDLYYAYNPAPTLIIDDWELIIT